MQNMIKLEGPVLRYWLSQYWSEAAGDYTVWTHRWRAPVPVNVHEARAALARLVERHESLRTIFALDSDGDPVALVLDSSNIDLPLQVTTEPIQDQGTENSQDGVWSRTRTALSRLVAWKLRVIVEDGVVRHFEFVHKHTLYDGGAVRAFRLELAHVLGSHFRQSPGKTVALKFPGPRNSLGVRGSQRNDLETDPWHMAPQTILPLIGEADGGEWRVVLRGAASRIAKAARDSKTSPATVCLSWLAWLLSAAPIEGVYVASVVSLRRSDQPAILSQSYSERLWISRAQTDRPRDYVRSVHGQVLMSYVRNRTRHTDTGEEGVIALGTRGLVSCGALNFDFTGEPLTMDGMAGKSCESVCLVRTPREVPESSPVFVVASEGSDLFVQAHASRSLLPDSFFEAFAEGLNCFLAAIEGGSLLNRHNWYEKVTGTPAIVEHKWFYKDAVASALRSHPAVGSARLSKSNDSRLTAEVALVRPVNKIALQMHLWSSVPRSWRGFVPLRIYGAAESRQRVDLGELGSEADLDNNAALVLRQLKRAILRYNPGINVNIYASYVGNGGNLRRAPAVAEELRRDGVPLRAMMELRTARPLAAVARILGSDGART